jgi:hypothetical protein
MSLDQVQLDPYFLAKMYTQPIIPGENTPVVTEQKAVPKVRFLGENQKNTALFIQNGSEAYLNDELFNLLTNILNACKLGMQDVALINIHNHPDLSISDWKQAVPFQRGVIFGATPAQFGLTDIPVYQLITVAGTTLLFSDSLELIGQDKTLKAKLWMGLKQLLGI